MATLPVILLGALLLLFAALLIQLWNVNEHTTAIGVSIIVSLTALMVTVTTVIPAVCNMNPSRTAFAPFQSPQTWIVFVVYRRLQQWLHSVFHAYAEVPITLANWLAFDLHFLEIEAKEWFDHETSSVHRALRWAYKVLCTSSTMETAVYWCLQEQFHPAELIETEDGLRRYILSGNEQNEILDNYDRLCYDCSERADGRQHIDSAIGRHQAELLIWSVYHTIVHAHGQERWDENFYCYDKLYFCRIFSDYSQEDMVHRTCLCV